MSRVAFFKKPEGSSADATPAADALLVERSNAIAALDRFDVFDKRVANAQAAAQRADASLRQFVAAETAALACWAEGGDGEAPVRDVALHSDLLAARVAAASEYDAAVAAMNAVAAAQARAAAAVSAVQLKLDERRAEEIATDVLRQVDELAHIVADARQRFAKIIGAREALWQKSWQFRDSGDLPRAQPWAVAAGRLADVTPVPIEASAARIAEFAAECRAKIR